LSGAGRVVRVFVILESSYILLLTLGPAAQATLVMKAYVRGLKAGGRILLKKEKMR